MMNVPERAAHCPEYQALKTCVKELRAQIPVDWPALESAIQAANARFHAIQDEWQSEQDRESARLREAFRGELDRHLSAFSPMERGRREKSLLKLVRHNGGEILARFQLAEKLVAAGWKWDGERLTGPDDCWMGPKDLTTFGLDYVRWLAKGMNNGRD